MDEFTVLFVCTANQCRSAMAQAIALDELARTGVDGLRFISAGTHALAGSPATDGTVRVMAERGLDLGRHRSRELDATVLAEADLVLAATREHIDRIVAWERSASRRTFTIAGFARAARAAGRVSSPDELVDLVNEHREDLDTDDIPDPVGQGEEAHRVCAERLDELVRPLVRALASAVEAGWPHPGQAGVR